mmetsp:Transcript_19773/g.41079  ORF Transcript_19773/g.41079 Transcript_19773/m.41079 type:complete len:214 (+) Transcript_19773:2440-3081(+)
MRLPSLSIWPLEYDREMVTASGRPSGMATTTMVTAMMKASMTCVQGSLPPCFSQIIAMRAMNVRTAAPPPPFPMSSTMSSSLSCRGVLEASLVKLALILPHWDSLPMPMQTTLASPLVPVSVTSQDERKKGSLKKSFLRSSGSPVRADSLHLTPEPSNKTPSAGIPSPDLRLTTSPTTSMSGLILIISPFLMTEHLSRASEFLSRSRNCFSFW